MLSDIIAVVNEVAKNPLCLLGLVMIAIIVLGAIAEMLRG